MPADGVTFRPGVVEVNLSPLSEAEGSKASRER
jgi:hypothetical protein